MVVTVDGGRDRDAGLDAAVAGHFDGLVAHPLGSGTTSDSPCRVLGCIHDPLYYELRHTLQLVQIGDVIVMTHDRGRRPWEADPEASFARRLGESAEELDRTEGKLGCPDIWELSNGDVAVIGRDLTASYIDRLPDGVSVVSDERLVIIPRATIVAAKEDIPDA